IDYMVSEKAAETWANAGYLPATSLSADAKPKLTPLLSSGIEMWKTLHDPDTHGLGNNFRGGNGHEADIRIVLHVTEIP
ncbi:hypothetical protein ACC689_36185, partial [Rhizobium ruizarguesonis]